MVEQSLRDDDLQDVIGQLQMKREQVMKYNILRWSLLVLAIPAGIAMCWIPWTMDAKHVAWGCPVPLVIWEKTEQSWIDFPCPVALVLNPLIMCMLALLFFWWAGRKIKTTTNNATSGIEADPG